VCEGVGASYQSITFGHKRNCVLYSLSMELDCFPGVGQVRGWFLSDSRFFWCTYPIMTPHSSPGRELGNRGRESQSGVAAVHRAAGFSTALVSELSMDF